MLTSDKDRNKALSIHQEFGPVRATSFYERLRKVYSDLSPSDSNVIEAWCNQVEHFAYDLAEQVRDKQLSQKDALLKISEQFPELDKKRVDKTYSQAMYFSSK